MANTTERITNLTYSEDELFNLKKKHPKVFERHRTNF